MGGNLFPILLIGASDGSNITNLHSLYDSVGGEWAGYMPRPTTREYREFIRTTARDLQQTYPQSFFPNLSPTDLYNYTSWAVESYQLGISTAYTQLTEGQTITQDYLNNILKPVLKQRVTLAGYRLAKILNTIITAPLPTPPVYAGSGGGWTSREVGFLVLLLIALFGGFPLMYYVGYRKATQKWNPGANESLLGGQKPADLPGNPKSRANYSDSNAMMDDMEIGAGDVVHSGLEKQRADERAAKMRQSQPRS